MKVNKSPASRVASRRQMLKAAAGFALGLLVVASAWLALSRHHEQTLIEDRAAQQQRTQAELRAELDRVFAHPLQPPAPIPVGSIARARAELAKAPPVLPVTSFPGGDPIQRPASSTQSVRMNRVIHPNPRAR